jgi:hypothetical protein
VKNIATYVFKIVKPVEQKALLLRNVFGCLQETYSRGSILQVPDCAQYFMENLDRLAEVDYVPTKVCNYPQSDSLKSLYL